MKSFYDLLESNPFDFSNKNKDLFVSSFKETALRHYNGNEFFKFLWDKKGIHPSSINSEDDLKYAPFVLVNLFKEHNFLSVPEKEIVLTLGSSGTSGQRSVMHLNAGSLERVKRMAYKLHKELEIVDEQKYNYLCFTYDPKIAGDVGTAFTDELLTGFTQKNEVFYALEYNEQKEDFEFNLEKTVSKLNEFAKSEYPLRILGFPAFLYRVLKSLETPLSLPKNSWVQTGGGWKSDADLELTKPNFREFVSKQLGISKGNIRDMFGMVEHGVPYLDCSDGKLRVPNYARVFIRDPFTLKTLNYGEKGLVQFMCSYNDSYPACNILATDWGVLHKDEKGEYLEILGRAGVSKNKGCALKANELLRSKHV